MSPPIPLAWRAIDARSLGLVVHPATVPGRAVFLRASAVFADHPEVLALLDGTMFDSPNILAYRYLDTAAGIDYPGIYPTRGATLSVVDGVASFREGAEVAPGAAVAVQGAFTVVRDGRADYPADRDAQAVWRGGFGLLDDGRVLWALGHGGMLTWARRLEAARFDGARLVRLVYSDGGHSAILWARDGSMRVGFPGDDPMIFGFLVERDGPASPMPPPAPFVSHPSTGRGGVAAARLGPLGPAEASGVSSLVVGTAAAAIAAGARAWRRRRR